MDFPKRKLLRLKDYDYGQSGAYFVTICTLQKEPILSCIVDPSRSSGVPGTAHPTDDAFVGNAVPGVPYPLLTPYGKATEKTILEMRQFYPHIRIEHFVIMPNHLHLIISVNENGVPGTAHPTISGFIGTMKRFIRREIGMDIWQASFYDHIIRDETDYLTKAQYIETNPARWAEDELYHA